MPTLVNDGIEIHWTERGNADASTTPVVLVHGLTVSSRMFERLATHLDHRWLVLVDVRGHGGSSEPDDPDAYSWSALVSDVHAVVDRLDLDEVVIGGTSLGADVTLAYADAHPERTAGLIVEMPVLAESEGFAREVFGAGARALRLAAPLLRPLTSRVGRLPLPRVPELLMARDVLSHDPAALAAVFEGLLASPQPDQAGLARIDAPALVIGHRHDRLHAIADAERVAEDMPKGELHAVRSFLHYRLHVGELARLIDDFLQRHDL